MDKEKIEKFFRELIPYMCDEFNKLSKKDREDMLDGVFININWRNADTNSAVNMLFANQSKKQVAISLKKLSRYLDRKCLPLAVKLAEEEETEEDLLREFVDIMKEHEEK